MIWYVYMYVWGWWCGCGEQIRKAACYITSGPELKFFQSTASFNL